MEAQRAGLLDRVDLPADVGRGGLGLIGEGLDFGGPPRVDLAIVFVPLNRFADRKLGAALTGTRHPVPAVGPQAIEVRMKPLSYAQNLEDYHLWLCFGGRTDGFYIDIGAGHPVADNVTFFLYERGWRGLVVEPQEDLARLYALTRPRDVAVATLVGASSGTARFHEVDRLHGLSSLRPEAATAARALGAAHRVVERPIVTLAELCERQGVTTIDVLKIDVEGAEPDVLAGNDWSRFRPKVVVAEAIRPGTQEPSWPDYEPILAQAGYDVVLDDTLNRFYVAREAADVLARAPRERAPWDAATHLYEIGRAPENPAHPDHDLALELSRGFWASLPDLDPDLLARLLARGRGSQDRDALALDLRGEAMRGRLGRIACGYDGGQV
jgi:FkbM family methyltransferase